MSTVTYPLLPNVVNTGSVSNPENLFGFDLATKTATPTTNWDCNWSFTSPPTSFSVDTSANASVQLQLAKNASGGGTPTFSVDLYENGSLVSNLASAVAQASEVITTYTYTFAASSVSNWANVEIYVSTATNGGGPNKRGIDLYTMGILVPITGSIVYPFSSSGTPTVDSGWASNAHTFGSGWSFTAYGDSGDFPGNSANANNNDGTGPTSESAAVTANNYHQFTVSRSSGTWDGSALAALLFGSGSGTAGTVYYFVRSSADSYTSNLATGTITIPSGMNGVVTSPLSISLTSFSNVSSVTFRIYKYGATGYFGLLVTGLAVNASEHITLSTVSDSFDSSWNVNSTVSDTQATAWNIAGTVGTSFNSAWDVLSTVSDSQNTAWDVLTPVEATQDTAWGVLSSVTATQDTAWSIAGTVGTSFDSAWNVNTSTETIYVTGLADDVSTINSPGNVIGASNDTFSTDTNRLWYALFNMGNPANGMFPETGTINVRAKLVSGTNTQTYDLWLYEDGEPVEQIVSAQGVPNSTATTYQHTVNLGKIKDPANTQVRMQTSTDWTYTIVLDAIWIEFVPVAGQVRTSFDTAWDVYGGATEVAVWDFFKPSRTPAPVSVAPGWTVSSWAAGPGMNSGLGVGATDYDPVYRNYFVGGAEPTTAYPTEPVARCATNSTTVSDAVTNNRYVEMTFSRTDSGAFTPAGLDIKTARGGTGTPRGMVIRGSHNSYASDIDTMGDFSTVRPTWEQWNLDLSSVGEVTTLTLRFYVYTTGTTSTIAFDDIVLTATVSAGTTTVGTSMDSSWNVNTAVAKTQDSAWDVLTSVTDSQATAWDVLASVADTQDTSWDVLTSVSDSTSTAWNIAASVADSFTSAWNVLATLTDTQDTSWAVYKPGSILYRFNFGGSNVTAIDGGPNWSNDTATYTTGGGWTNSADAGSLSTDGTVDTGEVPTAVWDNESYRASGGDGQMTLPVTNGTKVLVRIYYRDWWISSPGGRIFSVELNGVALPGLTNIDPNVVAGQYVGHSYEGWATSDGNVVIDWLANTENVAVTAMEVAVLDEAGLYTVGTSMDTAWDISAQVAKTQDTAWDVLTSVTDSQGTAWDVLTSVVDTQSTSWDVLTIVADTQSSAWSIRALVESTRDSAWDVLTTIADSQSSSWNIFEEITSTRDSAWDVLTTVADSEDTAWNVLQEAQDSLSSAWNLRALVSDTLDTSWDVYAAILKSFFSSWNVEAIGQVGNSFVSSWDVLASVIDSQDTEWDVLTVIADTQTSAWDVLITVSDTQDAAWDVLTTVGDSQDSAWDVLTTTGDSQDTAWSIRALVEDTQSTSWNISAQVADSFTSAWNVESITGVAQSFLTAWNVEAQVGTSQDTSWDVLTPVGTSMSAAWDVLTSLSDEVDAAWDVLTTVQDTQDAAWDVLTTVQDSQDSTWHVYVQVSQSEDSAWDIYTTVLDTYTSAWNIDAQVSAVQDSAWDIAQTITGTRSTSWNVEQFGQVANSFTSSWDVLTTVTDSEDAAWDVLTTVADTQNTSWDVLSGVYDSFDSAWNVEATTGVGNSMNTAWGINVVLTDTMGAAWDVLTTTSTSEASEWNVYETVADTADTAWSIRELVENTTDAAWDISEIISDTMPTSWDVLTTLGAQEDTSWHVYEIVADSLSSSWSIGGYVGNVMLTAWNCYPFGSYIDNEYTASLTTRRWTATVESLATSATLTRNWEVKFK